MMAIGVHHLCGGRMEPFGGSWVFGADSDHHHVVCHCLLIETEAGLVLVDAGIGMRDIEDPRGRLGRMFLALVRPQLRAEWTVVEQVRAKGFSPADVRHIVLTHLDLDHAGGLSDFPNATVHVMRAELDCAQAQATAADRSRYKPVQWSHGVDWRPHEVDGETWRGFDAVRDLPGLPPEVLLVPVAGHSPGHAAVAIDCGTRWLLHCGDAYFHRDEVNPKLSEPECPVGLRVFQSLVAHERATRLRNRQRLFDLAGAHPDDLRLVCAHDPHDFYDS